MKLDRIIAVRNNKTVYRDGDLCLKVFDNTYSKAQVLNEALNHALVEQTGLNIPKLHEVTVIDGKWTIITDFIKGKTLDRLISENPDKKDEYMDFFVNLQLEVLSKRCPLLTKNKDKMIRKIGGSNLDATTRYELYTRLDTMPKHNKLCHGDFNPSNIIVSDDGKPYILDWSHATQGNSSADVARTYLLLYIGYGKDDAEKYLDLFCDKSHIDKHYIKKWLPIVAAAQTVTCNKTELDFLLSWVNVVDFE